VFIYSIWSESDWLRHSSSQITSSIAAPLFAYLDNMSRVILLLQTSTADFDVALGGSANKFTATELADKNASVRCFVWGWFAVGAH
jgi:hypothetical protein